MKHLLPPLTSLGAVTLLAGCALPLTVFEGRYPMREGWHQATVVRTVSDADLPPVLRPDCGSGDSAPSAVRTAQWVIVDYRPAGRPRRVAVPASAALPAASGMPVYVQVQDCQRALAPRQAAS